MRYNRKRFRLRPTDTGRMVKSSLLNHHGEVSDQGDGTGEREKRTKEQL